jgi:hypothetical protein
MLCKWLSNQAWSSMQRWEVFKKHKGSLSYSQQPVGVPYDKSVKLGQQPRPLFFNIHFNIISYLCLGQRSGFSLQRLVPKFESNLWSLLYVLHAKLFPSSWFSIFGVDKLCSYSLPATIQRYRKYSHNRQWNLHNIIFTSYYKEAKRRVWAIKCRHV